jgi:chaperonin GroES
VPTDTGWSLTPATAGARAPCHSISTIQAHDTRHDWPFGPSDPEGGVTDVTTATKVNIKPLEDRVVVQANEAETTTASGLVIPDTAKEKPQEGTVIAVGPGRIDDNGNRVPLDVNVGDVVIYSKYGGTEVRYGGEEYLVLSARDLLAVVDK